MAACVLAHSAEGHPSIANTSMLGHERHLASLICDFLDHRTRPEHLKSLRAMAAYVRAHITQGHPSIASKSMQGHELTQPA